MVLDLLLVLDDKEVIKLRADEVKEALLEVQPKLNIKTQVLRLDSPTSIKTRRILFFLCGHRKGIHSRIKDWIDAIEYTFVVEIPYFIVFLGDHQNEIGTEDECIAKRIVDTPSLNNVTSWWPRIVRYLFEVEDFSEPFGCKVHNVSCEYEPADSITKYLTDLMSAFGSTTATCDYGFVVMRYESKGDQKTTDEIHKIKQSCKHLYVIGTRKEKPTNVKSDYDVYGRREILKLTLQILDSIGVIDGADLIKGDSLCTRLLGMHIKISTKKPPRSYNLTENRADVQSIGNANEGNSQTPRNLCCVVTYSRRCVAIILLILVVVIGSLSSGLLYLTIQHKEVIGQMEAMISTHEGIMDELEADAIRRFQAANITLYEEIGILKNETEEQFRETNETIFLTVEDLRNYTIIAIQEANMTIYTEIHMYENETDYKLAETFVNPIAFEARHVNNPSSSGLIIYTDEYTNEGNAYSAGYFNATVDGIYIAIFEICVVGGHNFEMYSQMPTTSKDFTFYSNNKSYCHSGFQVGWLATGQRMYTASYHAFDDVLLNVQSTSFSGFLINKGN